MIGAMSPHDSPLSPHAARPARLRLFFGLFPPPDVAAALTAAAQAAQQHCGGRVQAAPKLHLTLAFLGDATPEQADALAEFTRQARIEPGEVVLDRYGVFRKVRAAWIGPDPQSPDAARLAGLHAGLWRGIAPLGWSRPDETFRSHVTLLRSIKNGELAGLTAPAPIAWTYDRYSLVASQLGPEGSAYRILATTRA